MNKQKYTINDAIELSYNNDIIAFWKPYGEYGFLCQWWKCKFTELSQEFSCTEQYMMFEKAMLFGDTIVAQEIMKETNPAKMKDYGRKVHNYDQKMWDEYKEKIVFRGNLLKFSQNPDLKNKLLSTGTSILVEASPYDNIWGVKLSADNDDINYPEKWRGQNLLGFALMQVRDSL